MNAPIARLLVLTPLRIEQAAVRRRLPGAMVMHSGMGAVNARAAAFVAAGIPADAVAVAGFCGAVAEGLRAGDVVVASEVRGPEGVTVCDARPVVAALEARGIERVSAGPIASADHVVRGAERGVLAAQGALAADMESAWLAAAAAGRPLAVAARRARHAVSRDLPAVGYACRRRRGLAGAATGGARPGALGPGAS